MNCRNLSIAQRRTLLLQEFKSGKIANVSWTTAKSGPTQRNIKLWIEAALASGDKRIVNPPANKREDHLNVVDLVKYQEGHAYPWCTIDLNTVKIVKVGGKLYEF